MEPTAVKGEDFPLPATVSLHSVEVRAGTFWNGEICFSQTSLHPHCWWALSVPTIISPVDLGTCMVDPEALSDITSTKEG